MLLESKYLTILNSKLKFNIIIIDHKTFDATMQTVQTSKIWLLKDKLQNIYFRAI